jgi:ribosomal protein S12 methylthiotransferase
MKVGIVSLGCPKNQVDAEVMMGLLRAAGHVVTASERDAEVIIVNTCAFIREASEESIEAILEMAQLKDTGKLKHLITTGCLAQRYKAGLLRELPEVDAFLGTGEFDKIVQVVEDLSSGGPVKRSHRVPPPRYIYSHETPRIRFSPRHWSYLKIAEGCDNRCSYCMIPSMRGPLRSRDPRSIIEEARCLVSQGVKEVCLIAQDTTAYGCEHGKGKPGLPGLLRALEGVDGLSWIRVMYTHPAHITDELIEHIAGSAKTVHYIDMPLQHIDDDILKRMGRKVTSTKIRRLLEKIKKKAPDTALRTSLMVGFPGETHEKFASLLSFVKEAEFDHLGVFTYSEEEGIASAGMKRKVSDELMRERRDRIMKAQNRISLKKNKARVGKAYPVLVDGPSKETDLLLAGRTYFQAPEIDGVVYITDGEVKPGSFATVEITEAHPYDLVGRAVPER